MCEVEINSIEFRGLRVRIEVGPDEIEDAYFASSGNRLPNSMFQRLMSNTRDLEIIFDEYDRLDH